jgi:hypothetical protein
MGYLLFHKCSIYLVLFSELYLRKLLGSEALKVVLCTKLVFSKLQELDKCLQLI